MVLLIAATRAAGADLLRPIMDKAIWADRIIIRKLAGPELPAAAITDKKIIVHLALPDLPTEVITARAVLLPGAHKASHGKVVMGAEADEANLVTQIMALLHKVAGAALPREIMIPAR